MSLDPNVRLLDQDSGDLIIYLPADAPTLGPDDTIIVNEVGGGPISYTVEAVNYICEYETLGTPGLPDEYEVHGRIDYIVSEIP